MPPDCRVCLPVACAGRASPNGSRWRDEDGCNAASACRASFPVTEHYAAVRACIGRSLRCQSRAGFCPGACRVQPRDHLEKCPAPARRQRIGRLAMDPLSARQRSLLTVEQTLVRRAEHLVSKDAIENGASDRRRVRPGLQRCSGAPIDSETPAAAFFVDGDETDRRAMRPRVRLKAGRRVDPQDPRHLLALIVIAMFERRGKEERIASF